MKTKAFILRDLLLTLVIIMTLFPIIVSVTKVISDFDYFDKRLQDELSILHMQKRLIVVSNLCIYNHELTYDTNDQSFTLKYDGRRLYLVPGYQLILDEVTDLSFRIDGNLVYINYIKDDIQYEKLLTII